MEEDIVQAFAQQPPRPLPFSEADIADIATIGGMGESEEEEELEEQNAQDLMMEEEKMASKFATMEEEQLEEEEGAEDLMETLISDAKKTGYDEILENAEASLGSTMTRKQINEYMIKEGRKQQEFIEKPTYELPEHQKVTYRQFLNAMRKAQVDPTPQETIDADYIDYHSIDQVRKMDMLSKMYHTAVRRLLSKALHNITEKIRMPEHQGEYVLLINKIVWTMCNKFIESGSTWLDVNRMGYEVTNSMDNMERVCRNLSQMMCTQVETQTREKRSLLVRAILDKLATMMRYFMRSLMCRPDMIYEDSYNISYAMAETLYPYLNFFYYVYEPTDAPTYSVAPVAITTYLLPDVPDAQLNMQQMTETFQPFIVGRSAAVGNGIGENAAQNKVYMVGPYISDLVEMYKRDVMFHELAVSLAHRLQTSFHLKEPRLLDPYNYGDGGSLRSVVERMLKQQFKKINLFMYKNNYADKHGIHYTLRILGPAEVQFYENLYHTFDPQSYPIGCLSRCTIVAVSPRKGNPAKGIFDVNAAARARYNPTHGYLPDAAVFSLFCVKNKMFWNMPRAMDVVLDVVCFKMEKPAIEGGIGYMWPGILMMAVLQLASKKGDMAAFQFLNVFYTERIRDVATSADTAERIKMQDTITDTFGFYKTEKVKIAKDVMSAAPITYNATWSAMNEEQLDKLNVAKIWFASMVHEGKKPSHHIVEPPSIYYYSPVIAYQHRIVSQEEQERAMAQQQQSVV